MRCVSDIPSIKYLSNEVEKEQEKTKVKELAEEKSGDKKVMFFTTLKSFGRKYFAE